MGSEIEVSSNVLEVGGYPVINHTGLSDTFVTSSGDVREIAEKLSRWVDNARAASTRHGMFDRGAYTPPANVYDEMRAARHALEYDDIVGGVAEITEAFAFQGVKFESEEPDEADIFNQIARDLNLDAHLRKMWREEYATSQSVTAMVMGRKSYKVRGKNEDGNQRRKKYDDLVVPVQLSVLDSTKVVPVGTSPLGPQMLAWCSTAGEVDWFRRARSGEVIDPQMLQFFIGTYTPGPVEEAELTKLGVDTKNLLVMNPSLVFRHTLTKPDYERFAPVRLKGVFRQLDLKQQLMAADRAMLVGAANYILLIKKGDKEHPATPEEMSNLKQNYNFIAKLPVIISDHRLEIEIIAPKVDHTLQQDRYDLIDTRLLARLLGTLSLGGRGQRNETNVTLSRAVAKSMENRRHMIKRTIEERIVRPIIQANSEQFKSEPNLVFVPRNIALDVDAAMVQAIVSLRTQRELSRESVLELFGFDQAIEAQRRELEEKVYDDIFKTHTPFDSPMGDPHQNGAQGGRPQGGGQSSGDTTKPKARTANGNPKTGGDK